MKVNSSEIKSILKNIDLFICSSGFESRSTSFPNAVVGHTIKNALLFHIDENYIVSYKNYEEIKTLIPQIEIIEHPKNNPIETYDIILDKLEKFYERVKHQAEINIVVDITTFTREVLLILLKAIYNEKFITLNVNLVYTPAENYPSEWLTKGVRYIRSIFGYSGMMLPSKRLMLIVLNGFENERTEEIINSFEPSAILLGKPSREDSINKGLGDRGEENFELIKFKYSSTVIADFEFSCKEIDKTIFILEKLIGQYGSDYNIVISPLNNKVSTIAAAFVALRNESVQVCYASANQYNINEYSTPCDYFLIFETEKFLKKV